MIRTENLSVTTDGYKILENINVEIPKNSITVILGTNGTGKTTFLKAISKIIPSNGCIERNYKSVFYLPQRVSYPQGITLFEYIESSFFGNGWKWFLTKDEKIR